MLCETLKHIRLHQVHVRIVWFHNASRDFSLLSCEHRISHILWIIALQLILIFLFVVWLFWLLIVFLLSFHELLTTSLPRFFSSLRSWNVWRLLLNCVATVLRLLICRLCRHLHFCTLFLRSRLCLLLLWRRFLTFTAILTLVDGLLVIILVTLLVIIVVIVAETLRRSLYLFLFLIVVIGHITVILIEKVIFVN